MSGATPPQMAQYQPSCTPGGTVSPRGSLAAPSASSSPRTRGRPLSQLQHPASQPTPQPTPKRLSGTSSGIPVAAALYAPIASPAFRAGGNYPAPAPLGSTGNLQSSTPYAALSSPQAAANSVPHSSFSSSQSTPISSPLQTRRPMGLPPVPATPTTGPPTPNSSSSRGFNPHMPVQEPQDQYVQPAGYEMAQRLPTIAQSPSSGALSQVSTAHAIDMGYNPNDGHGHAGTAPVVGWETQNPAPDEYNPRFDRTLYRSKTKKTLKLTREGNFVVDIPVPEKVLSVARFRNEQEFTHMRYTAVLGDPNEFIQRGYTLRQNQLGRETELFVVITMYNEDDRLFCKTWKSVQKNIANLCAKKGAAFWGPDAWQKIVVCVISDGRQKIHPRTLNVLGVMGAFQDGVMKTSVNGQEVSAHVFEYTTQVLVDTDSLQLRSSDQGVVPVQVLFCLKEKNAKKINSHRWFFNAFGRALNPQICVLLDVGTKPSETSFWHLWHAFDRNPRVAGACGEIYAETGHCGSKLLNPLVAAQNFEYKMSNILDKPLESVFGFIAVLPGAFSAYRFKALQNGPDGTGPLEKYFFGETLHGAGDVMKANMYLAEDRILCFELVTKWKERWVLQYVKAAKAETDVPDTVPEFVSQRRRWLNGSFFAGVHAIMHWYQIFRSGHSWGRQFFLLIQMLYNVIQLVYSWFSLGNTYLIFYFLTADIVSNPQEGQPNPFGPNHLVGQWLFLVLRYLYMGAIILVFISSLGNRPQGSKIVYVFAFFLFAIIMGFMLYMAAFTIYLTVPKSNEEWRNVTNLIVDRPSFRDLVLSVTMTYGIYFVSSFIFFEPWHMFTSFLQYLFLLPSFINILMVYAFSNLHDVSWGTKGDNSTTVDSAPVKVVKQADGQLLATVNIPSDQADIDSNYDNFLRELPNRPKEVKGDGRSAALKQEDWFRTFRSNVVLAWILSNALLIVLITTPELGLIKQDRSTPYNPYLTFILWSVAGISGFRFIGSVAYLFTQ
ncbi:chitin synthase [Synchytrium endobioticum]|uniref:Chitin synthase n=1 Tax=Synchytrium endobioticum TaxID=286115 RepID=A0A507D9N3_9FUNG|nr:chitin synthase [Synchytrium endobioticum]TPX49293.1 chitin synthase [Synchytrium endobioticum]